MRTSILLGSLSGAALLSIAGAAYAAPTGDVPLIERTKLFGNPTRTNGRLSPDGKWLAFIAPQGGVQNIWVAPVDRPNEARALTAETKRPIRSYFWSPDSRQILFVNDKGGDENFLLYGVDLTTGRQRALTPFEKTTVQVIGMSDTIKDRILLGVNNRDPRWHDVQELNLATGKLTPVLQNDGYAGFITDDQLRVRIAVKPRADSGMDYYRVTDNKVEATPFTRVDYEDASTTIPYGFTTDGKTLYWGDARGRDTVALLAQDMATGKFTTIGASDRADVGAGLTNPKTGVVEAYSVNFHRNEYVPVGEAVKADLAFLKAQNKGEFYIGTRTDADDKWLVTFDPVSAPSSTWLYDRRARKLTALYTPRPELVGAPLVGMEPVDIPTRDGLSMVSYLTRPKGATGATPMVLLVHGGPWGRDSYGYNGYHQWLANRGYAVLSVNFRASTGFGKKFVQAGDRQWGRKMHDDLIDAVDWAVKRGVTTSDKVAIMGGSYGGYATLAGLTMTPDKFACGVDIVGPSNLFTLLKTIPPYWEAGKQQMYRRMGDPTTPEGQALLKERSPLTYADAIKRPLLIGQGANDPRVNVAESDQIVAAMQAKKIPVTYVVFPDEGHGFARPANNIAFNAVAENFLAKCLGGRAEPIGGALAASTAQVKAGSVEGAVAPGAKGN
ncbi:MULTISPECIES: S9 family peptidase [Sphingomonas]|jgi:dipeptidyl aminopeptidase/acylaminoacyl peptidase|uniref:Peptidase S9 n=1 Tax=Sphingomonas hankookensis TaxID=563996 RepID=A0ABR5YCL0_9SPHN|nr:MULTISPECIES: S9 family peptidase [Sphingomonas]KZE15398.1 peptidase S9 [Sphingomonas hankookensis]PZT96329.1 MAG: S9 family peptidase [Sphingomonas sp.]RSV18702.1 S9 family peptidase [Sphingomonas sp. ABOLH]WCP70953.1 S9 family peptidase [Sphingomonas hankookensis]